MRAYFAVTWEKLQAALNLINPSGDPCIPENYHKYDSNNARKIIKHNYDLPWSSMSLSVMSTNVIFKLLWIIIETVNVCSRLRGYLTELRAHMVCVSDLGEMDSQVYLFCWIYYHLSFFIEKTNVRLNNDNPNTISSRYLYIYSSRSSIQSAGYEYIFIK